MISPQLPSDEKGRLKNLKAYNILDSLPEEDYDNITRLASQICNTPIALISLIDETRQWFKSHHGLEASQTPREVAFCAHAINNPKEILVVNDSRLDERFYDNPLVTGDPHVIFYTGVPLISPEGFPLGTICVIDNKPNSLDENQKSALGSLSKLVITLFEARKNSAILEETQKRLEEKNVELERFAQVAAHDLKSPLNTIVSLTDLIETKYIHSLEADLKELFSHIKGSSQKLAKLVTGILEHSKSQKLIPENKTDLELDLFLSELITLLDYEKNYQFLYSTTKTSVSTNKVALEQIFINLITNAIKYNDKELVVIEIGFWQDDHFYNFFIKDNGTGIPKELQKRIFDIFDVQANKDRFGNRGNGIGLATVKSLVEGLGGTIAVESQPGMGSTFEFTIAR